MNRTTLLTAAIVVVLAALGAWLFVRQRGTGGAAPAASGTLCANKPAPAPGLTNASVTALKIEDTKEGSGPQAITSNTVRVNYIGRTVDGKEFDSSCKEGREPFEFQLGAGQVIPGWDSGIVGMRVGGGAAPDHPRQPRLRRAQSQPGHSPELGADLRRGTPPDQVGRWSARISP